jgi:hypothetical protein
VRSAFYPPKTRHHNIHLNRPANGNPVTLTLPTNVEPGDYLVRHEIISLRVGGSQSGTPNQTVSFPCAYSDTDPGILDPNVYNPGSPYVFPGPPVSNLASPRLPICRPRMEARTMATLWYEHW